MKRTAAALALLAGFSGGCMSTDGGGKQATGGYGTVTRGKELGSYQGPEGQPIVAARGASPGAVSPAVFRKFGTPSAAELQTVAHIPGRGAGCSTCADGVVNANFGGMGGPAFGGMGGMPGPAYGGMPGHGGIVPTPGMGPPGAVAGVGALGIGGPGAGAIPNGRTSINFTGPPGMKVTWQLPDGSFNAEAAGLTAPAPYNFLQGQVYRLRLTQVLPNHPGRTFYPTLEIASANPRTITFLAHAAVPVTFTNEDFEQAVAGNLVVKVIYLPDRDNQDFVTVAGGIEELVSTRLEPGADPVAEAQRRGTVLAIIRMGNIDLENKNSPAMNAIPMGPMGPMGPGLLPPGMPLPGGPIPKGPTGGSGMPPGGSRIGSADVSGPLPPTRPVNPNPLTTFK
jgi:hypothetical protein